MSTVLALAKPHKIAYPLFMYNLYERAKYYRPTAVVFLGIALLAALVACSARPTAQYVLGDLLLEEDFDRASAWEWYRDPSRSIDMRVQDGVYRAQAGAGTLMWALNAQMHTDVVIQVDTQRVSGDVINAHGLMCRASPSGNGNGYYFLISADGAYTIRRGAGDQVTPLVPWQTSRALNRGQVINRLRVVCIGDYLALYVNGEFVAEARDNRYHTGVAGLAVAAPNSPIEVTFDRVIIWSAQFATR
ncbi:MAG: hypothetical protein SNJ59_03325 [Aggregatilineales bacterium]